MVYMWQNHNIVMDMTLFIYFATAEKIKFQYDLFTEYCDLDIGSMESERPQQTTWVKKS